MKDAGRRTRFAQETKPSRFVIEIFFVDDFQCHGTSKIDLGRFIVVPIALGLARAVSDLRRSSAHNARTDAIRRGC